jgi:Right handed beta helix region
MKTWNRLRSWIFARNGLFLLALGALFPAITPAQLVVDCSGNTPGAFTTINAALSSSGPGSAIFLAAGTCNEDLNLAGQIDLFIGTYYGTGQRVTLNGKVVIGQSHGVYLHGLDITSTTGDGINASQTQAIIIDSCTSNGNGGNGLTLSNNSEANIIAPSSFDNNSGSGMNLSGNSIVELAAWNGGTIDISGNHGPGVFASQAYFNTLGHTTIYNNVANSDGATGFGLDLRGSAKAQFGALSGPNTIFGNQQGGVSLQETSEISFWNGGYQNLIQNNGPVGVTAGFGSQVTFYSDVEVSGHTGPALDLYANSQGYLFGANYLHNNGTVGDPRSAAIRADGNSEALLRGGTISQNFGPAMLVLVNSSVDFTGVSFSSNSAGIVSCDTSAFMVSDLSTGLAATPGVACRTPHALGNRSIAKLQPMPPDFTAVKALQAKYMALATRK